MGFSFTNLHLRHTSALDADALADRIARGHALRPVSARDEADVITAIYHPEGAAWVTIVSDVFDADVEKQTALAKAFSQEYGVPALAVSCYDSDFLMMNWLDEGRGHDLFATTGSAAEAGLKGMRRSNFAAWRKVLPDAETFKQAMRRDRIFAEECMADVADMLALPKEQGQACLELLDELPGARMYYYAAAVRTNDAEKPRLAWSGSGTFGMTMHADFYNQGGASKGMTVMVMGEDVLSGEVELLEPQIIFKKPNRELCRIPVQWEQVTASDGTKWLRVESPDVPLRSMPVGLPDGKAFQARLDREVTLEFGVKLKDPARVKYAPVTVVMTPMENAAGQAQTTLFVTHLVENMNYWKRVREKQG